MKTNQHKLALPALLGTVFLLSGCGGSSSSNNNTHSGSSGTNTGIQAPQWTAGQFPPASLFKDFCEVPRTGLDPFNQNRPYPDRAGTSMHEKMWLRSWTHDTYLWYDEVPDVDPRSLSIAAYFNQLKTTAVTDSGALKDNFHFSMPTAEYNQSSQAAVSTGYGIRWIFGSNQPPRELTVAYVEPGSPAAMADITRGDTLAKIGNIDFVQDNSTAGANIINNALFPATPGFTEQFTFNRNGTQLSVELSSANVQEEPVHHPQIFDGAHGKIGYMQFNSFGSPARAQDQLIQAISNFAENNVHEVVLDLRYNGGGAVALASQLGYMLTGDAIIQDRIFSDDIFNDKHPHINPVTGAPLIPLEFIDEEINYETWRLTGVKLPELLLNRVYILSTEDTCSASESLINGLRGIDVDVILIGSTTCGKPYGFYPEHNCGTTYFTIQMAGINAKGFGDFADGFTPSISPVFSADVAGCPLQDDLSRPLGHPEERLLSAALHHIEYGSCPATVSTQSLTPWSYQQQTRQDEQRQQARMRSHFLEKNLRNNSVQELPWVSASHGCCSLL